MLHEAGLKHGHEYINLWGRTNVGMDVRYENEKGKNGAEKEQGI
jgi:hypothetical protein